MSDIVDRESVANGDDKSKVALDIERLIEFSIQRDLLDPLDSYTARNALLDLLRIEVPYDGEVMDMSSCNIAELLEPLLNYAASAGILENDSLTFRDLLDTRIMGCLMPSQSEVARHFWTTVMEDGVRNATDHFYRQCIDSNYIRMDRIQKNRYWLTNTAYGDLEITVNLSKPEKDPREIALVKNLSQRHYPKCLLCIENVGFAGRIDHPARQNLRVIPLQLDGEPWFFQYSPYVYYNEHCIIFDKIHRPMTTSKHTFSRLIDFVDQFPHYFIGSNADLPIVGGSILNHDHFQGGNHQFAMDKAPVESSYTHPEYPEAMLGIVKWPMSVIRISSNNKLQLLQIAGIIFNAWKAYTDEANEIQAFTEHGTTRTPHNTITSIARLNAKHEYELDLILRNNRTNNAHPDGIFHPYEEHHHIKKENIGLIEAMGLAVLPGRLHGELEQIGQVLAGKIVINEQMISEPDHPLHKHITWIGELILVHGTALSEMDAERVLKAEVAKKFNDILHNAGVYKRNQKGQEGFITFLKTMGLINSNRGGNLS